MSTPTRRQPLDATLTALAAIVTETDKLIYATGVDTFATTTITAFTRTLLDDVDQATARTTLGAAATSDLANYLPLSGGTLTAALSSSNILTLIAVGSPYTGNAIKFLNAAGYSIGLRLETYAAQVPLVIDASAAHGTAGYQGGLMLKRNGTKKLEINSGYASGTHIKSYAGDFRLLWEAPAAAYEAVMMTFDGSVNLCGSNCDTVNIWNGTTLKQKFANAEHYLYHAFTDASNYQAAKVSAGVSSVTFGADTAGTGADNIDVVLAPAGTGLVQFGGHSAVGAETVTGYITIKDSGGTERKLAVIS